MNRKAAGSAGVGVALIFLLFLLAVPLLIVGGTSMLFAGGGSGCTQAASPPPVTQPGVSAQANSIPATYLKWYKLVGLQSNIPWTILAGIGTVESNNGQSNLPLAAAFATVPLAVMGAYLLIARRLGAFEAL